MAKKSGMNGMRTVNSKAAINQGKGLSGAGMSSTASPKYKANKSIGEMKGKKPPIAEGKKSKKATSKKGKIPPQFLKNIKTKKSSKTTSKKGKVPPQFLKDDTITDGKKHKQKRYPKENVKDKIPHSLEKKVSGKKGKKIYNKSFENAEPFYTKKTGSPKKAKEIAAKVAVKAVEKAGKFKGKSGGKKKAVTTKKKSAAKKSNKKTIAEGNPITPTKAVSKIQAPNARKRSMPTNIYGNNKKK